MTQRTVAEEIALIEAEIANLNPDDETHWTKDGRPNATVLSEKLGFVVTKNLRDSAWENAMDKKAPVPKVPDGSPTQVAAALDAQPEPENVKPKPRPSREEFRKVTEAAAAEGKVDGSLDHVDGFYSNESEETGLIDIKALTEEQRRELLLQLARPGELASDRPAVTFGKAKVVVGTKEFEVSPSDFDQKQPLKSFGEVVSHVFVHNETGVKFLTNKALAEKKKLPVYPF